MHKKRFLGLSVLLVVFLLLSVLTLGGCDTETPPDDDNGAPDTPDPPDPDPDPDPDLIPDEKTLNIAVHELPVTLDPFNHRQRGTTTINSQYLSALAYPTHDGRVIYDLATSIEMMEDEVTYEIKVREGVTFHNGDSLTAEDVAFSIERMAMEGGMEGETSPTLRLLHPVESVEVKDDYTVIVKFESPDPDNMPRKWVNVFVLPKSYFQEVGPEKFMENPIGTGPFKWVEGDLNSYAVFERFENFYGGPEELREGMNRIPSVDRLVIYYVLEPATRISALQAGDVDIITNVPIDDVETIRDNPDTEISDSFGTAMVFMGFNCSLPPFDDNRVRRAIAHAIDYDLIADYLLSGVVTPLYAMPFMEPFKGDAGSGVFDHSEFQIEHNPEIARELLEEAGQSDLSLIIDATIPVADTALAIAQMLADVGIDASVRTWERAALRDVFPGTRHIYMDSGGNARRIPERWNVHLNSKAGGNFLVGGYNNPEWDAVMEKIGALRDSPERNELLKQAYHIALEDMPQIPIYETRVINAYRSNIKNYQAHPIERVQAEWVDME